MPSDDDLLLPLRKGETYQDRERIDAILQKYWGCHDRRAWIRTEDEVKKVYLTYGEVTSLGARQVMELLEFRENINIKMSSSSSSNTSMATTTTRKEDNNNNNNDDIAVEVDNHHQQQHPIIFYDLGSGAGKLVVQMVLEKAVTVSIGIELSEARHELALEIWDTMQTKEKENRFDGDDDDDDTAGLKTTTYFYSHQDKETGAYITVPRIQFQNKNILDADFSNATHIFFSSLCFPDDVIEQVGEMIRQNRELYGKIQVVVALSNIRSLEGPKNRVHWKKSFNTILMTWGYSTARIYKYIE